MKNNCIECGRLTYSKTCPDCTEGKDSEGISSVKLAHLQDDFLAEHRDRIIAHAHRVGLDEECMRYRGLDPHKYTIDGRIANQPNSGKYDILQVRYFHQIYRSTKETVYGDDVKSTKMSPEMRLATAIVASSDESLQRGVSKDPELGQEWTQKYRKKRR